jgi:hypothetical protein
VPETQHVIASADHPQRIAVGMRSGGYYFTEDAGRTWSWLCEEALFYDDSETYPGVLSNDGSLVVSAGFRGVAASSDGCEWSNWSSGQSDFIVDLKYSALTQEIVALNSITRAGIRTTEVWVSTDGGRNFEQRGQPLPVENEPKTLSAADSGHYYVAAATAAGATLFETRDAGAVWTERLIDANVSSVLRIAGVFENTVVLTLHRTVDGTSAQDRVLLADATSVRILFDANGELAPAALAPDGTIAFGGPAGVWVSRYTAGSFSEPERMSDFPTRGLTFWGTRLLSAGSDLTDGFSLAISDDFGKTFAPFLRLCEANAGLICASETSAAAACVDHTSFSQIAATDADSLCRSTAPAAAPAEESSGGCSQARHASRKSQTAFVAILLLVGLSAFRRRACDAPPLRA